MNTVLKPVPLEVPPAPESAQKTLMELLQSRESQEIVIAFAGPIGVGIQSVITKTKAYLGELGYKRVKIIKLSKFLQDALDNKQTATLNLSGEKSAKFVRYRNLQHAGRDLRERTENMRLLAEYAVKEIVVDRKSKGGGPVAASGAAPAEVDPPRTAYLIDQVKRPEEVELLRAMYRHLFYLVGVTKSYVQRWKTLEDDGLDEEEITDLMEIDRNEVTEKGGQRLEKTLHLADFFIRNDAGLDQRDSVRRFTRLIHGDKSLTPNRIETGMYAAYAASLRSACLSRQVGAAIATSSGEVLATGCNDVPAAGGGLYPSSSIDFRCVHKPGRICFNDQEKRDLQSSIGRVFREEFKKLNCGDLSEPWLTDLLQSLYEKTRLGSLIEFSRSVHAEMDAIVSLARRGSSGLDKATLFTTTFPCHSCARHIVAAGISEVFYIEPYEKSMAQQLHKDAIAFEEPRVKAKDAAPMANQKAPLAVADKDEDFKHDRVKFLHFEGVSPRLFAAAFRADDRKDKVTGKFIPMSENNPAKILPEYLVDYREFEKAAVRHFDGMMKDLGLDPGLTKD